MLLALDLGTNALKLGLFDAAGQPHAFLRRAYDVQRGPAGEAEADPDEWWRVTCAALGELLAPHDVRQIAALCVIGQGPTLVVADAQLRARAPALLWADRRDSDERARLSTQLGYEVSSYSLLPKISWLARARPALFDAQTRVLQAYDFIAARLAGQPFASQYGPWPPFAADEFARASLDARWIPPLVPMGQVVGETRAPWCAQAHLPVGIPIIAGVYDAIPTTLGTALVEVGRACDYGGQSGGYGLCWHAPLSAAGIGAWPGLCEGQYIVGGATASAGMSIDWFARTFGGAAGLPTLLRAAAEIAPGADGLLCLPYFAGERAPLWDDALRGAFVGLALHHERAHLARALLEGIAFGLRHIERVVAGAGGQLRDLRVCGGTAHYELLNQIKADVLGVPALVPRVIEAGLLGAAMIAAVGMGQHADYPRAAQAMVHIERQLTPDAHAHARYDALFEQFRALTALRLR